MSYLGKVDVSWEVVVGMEELDLNLGQYYNYLQVHYDIVDKAELEAIEQIAEEFGPGWEEMTAEQLEEWLLK